MQCNKLGKGFLKVRAKVTGFLIAKIEKRNTPEKIIVTIKNKKNTIIGLQYLLNAFQTYMSGVNYVGKYTASSGIVLTTSSGQTYTLPFVNTPSISVTSNSAIVSFTVTDDSTNSYTATSEELITESAKFNIPIATASLSVTKNSDEVLTMTWVITVTISTSGQIIYIPTLIPQNVTITYASSQGSGCAGCATSSTNSEYASFFNYIGIDGLISAYPNTNLVTTQLFTDIFYNTYSEGSSNSFTYASGTTLIIYTGYCYEYFIAGPGQFLTTGTINGNSCTTEGSGVYPVITPVYLQAYFPSETEPYIGVQIEFTT